MTIFKKIGLTMATLAVACSLCSVSRVHADTYYGNGVHCNTHRCYVDWGTAWSNILTNSGVNWLTGGHAGWHG